MMFYLILLIYIYWMTNHHTIIMIYASAAAFLKLEIFVENDSLPEFLAGTVY